MTRSLKSICFLILVLRATFVAAEGQRPLAEIKLTTQGKIWLGQQVVLAIVLKTPETFASAPMFDLPSVAGLIFVPPSARPVVGTETVGDVSFTTQTHELTVVSQREGEISIPPFTIRFDSSAGFGKPVTSRTVKTEALSFSVTRPPGTEQLAIVLTTEELTVKETWKPQLTTSSMPVGAAITRTIESKAMNLPGIVLPSFQCRAPEGLRVYESDPVVNDRFEDGKLVGQRIDVTTIVCERGGHYELPAMTLKWWNPKEQTLSEVKLPSYSIVVNAPLQPIEKAESSPKDTSSHLVWRRILLLACVALLLGLAVFRRPLEEAWHQFHAAAEHSERFYFNAVLKACRSGDSKATYRAIVAWRAKLASISDMPQRSVFEQYDSDPALQTELLRLESDIYGPMNAQAKALRSPERMIVHLTDFRSRWEQHRADAKTSRVLPEMNPARTAERWS